MDFAESWGPGHVIAGKYRLVRQLGKGGMGSVWAADHLALSSEVAIKIIDPAIARNQEALARFLREAQSAAALRSPHVVQTFDYGVHEDVPFIAMELLEGDSLAQRLELGGPLSVADTAKILTQVGRAISRAHEAGIVHRDLKPDNIFLVKNDDEEIAKVLDFGIAKATGGVLGNSSQTRTGAILGTPYYMSPEQAEGNRSVDHRTDLWSLAVIAFECVTGRRPFESEALGDLILQICVRPIKMPSSLASVPPAFDAWYAKATQRDPSQRFQSARELTAALRSAVGLGTGADTGRTQRMALPSAPELDAKPAFAATPSPSVDLQAPPRPFNGTTGGVSSLAKESRKPPAETSTRLVIGTLAAMILAGIVVFLVFRSKSHEEARPSTSAAGPQASVAVAVPPRPVEPEPAVAPPTTPSATAAPEPAVAPAATAAVATSTAAAPANVPAAKVPAHAAKPSAGKKTEKPAATAPKPKQRIDFGF
jgi:serine/threonine protein kinase